MSHYQTSSAMRFTLIFACLALFQASPSIPREAARNPSENDQDKQTQRTSEKRQSAESSAGADSIKSKVSTSKGSEQTPKTEEETIPVRVAPVDVKKDCDDYLFIAKLLLTLSTLAIAVYAA